jgi:hypothetical protein
MAVCITLDNKKEGLPALHIRQVPSFACLAIHIALLIDRDSDNDSTASVG